MGGRDKTSEAGRPLALAFGFSEQQKTKAQIIIGHLDSDLPNYYTRTVHFAACRRWELCGTLLELGHLPRKFDGSGVVL